MRASFHCKLINPPFEDPGLYVSPRFGRRAFLFDLGQLENLTSRELLAVTDIFITHAHLDHFCGFDRLLRVCLRRPGTIRIFGPEGIVQQVEHKLHAYTWNLVGGAEDACAFEVIELSDTQTRRTATFRAQDAFEASAERTWKDNSNVILSEPGAEVTFATLDHGIPCLAFCLREPTQIGFLKEKLHALGVKVGPWLDDLKYAILSEEPGSTLISPRWKGEGASATLPLSAFEGTFIRRPGQAIAYVTDIAYTDDNVDRLRKVAHGVHTLYIEASFRAVDVERAAERKHLTSAQAGSIGRALEATRVVPFHFSPRHLEEEDEMRREVEEAWLGEGTYSGQR